MTAEIQQVNRSSHFSLIYEQQTSNKYNMLGYNVHFVKCPEQHLAKVVTLRPIVPGEELFANYGTILLLSFPLPTSL